MRDSKFKDYKVRWFEKFVIRVGQLFWAGRALAGSLCSRFRTRSSAEVSSGDFGCTPSVPFPYTYQYYARILPECLSGQGKFWAYTKLPDVNPEPETPSPLMGEGWGGGGYFASTIYFLLHLPPSPNPLSLWGGGFKRPASAKNLPDTTGI